MPGYRRHITLAVVFGALLVAGLAYSSMASVMPLGERIAAGVVTIWLAAVFALFPDIDIKSRGQLLFYRLFFVLDLGLMLAGRTEEAAVLGFLALFPILSPHRGWTHSPLAMILVPLPILAGPMYLTRSWTLEGLPFYLGAVAGYLSHLLADGTIRRRGRWWWV